MSEDTIIFIGLDTHKKHHHAAYMEDGRGKEVVDYGRIPSTKTALTKFLKKNAGEIPESHFTRRL